MLMLKRLIAEVIRYHKSITHSKRAKLPPPCENEGIRQSRPGGGRSTISSSKILSRDVCGRACRSLKWIHLDEEERTSDRKIYTFILFLFEGKIISWAKTGGNQVWREIYHYFSCFSSP
jgi:hypothetical protein